MSGVEPTRAKKRNAAALIRVAKARAKRLIKLNCGTASSVTDVIGG